MVKRNLVRNPSFEINADNWVVGANCTLAKISTVGAVGIASLSLTAVADGAEMAASNRVGVEGIPITGGMTYTAQVRFRAQATVRSVRAAIFWADAAGASAGSVNGTTVTDNTTGWTTATVTATAPAGAAFARTRPQVLSPLLGEVHYIDAVMVHEGSPAQPYADGETEGWGWDGVAHNSQSRELPPPAFPLVRLVDRVPRSETDKPSLLFDLNDADPWMTEHDNFTLGAPTYEGAPGSVGVDYGQRRITLSPYLDGDASTALAALAALSRVLVRPGAVLMLQLGPDNKPTYFPLYVTEPQALDWTEVREPTDDGSLWRLRVELDAEAFGYGPKVTLPLVSMTSDPHPITPGAPFHRLPEVKGDAPAPLTVQITPSVSWYGFRPLISVAPFHPVANPTAAVVWQTNLLTQGLDTTDVADTTFSGTRRSRVFFTTDATMRTRLSGTVPATPYPGRYKVLVRVSRSDLGSRFNFRFGQRYDTSGNSRIVHGSTVSLTRAASPTNGFTCLIDLGDFTFPLGAEDLDITDLDSNAAPIVNLQVERTAGGGNLDLDYFILIPLDGAALMAPARTLMPYFFDLGLSSTRRGVWDADRRRYTAYDSSGMRAPGVGTLNAGQYPQVVPGAANVLHLLHQTYADTPSDPNLENRDTLGATADVVLSYHPRYLHLRPDDG